MAAPGDCFEGPPLLVTWLSKSREMAVFHIGARAQVKTENYFTEGEAHLLIFHPRA